MLRTDMDVFSPRQGANAPGRARVLLAGTALSATVALLVLADRPAASLLTLNATSETVRIESVERHALDRHGSHVGHGGAATEIHVVVQVENRTDRAIPYSPGQFRLRRGNAPGTVAPVQTRVVTRRARTAATSCGSGSRSASPSRWDGSP